jgi:hypothetical protein
MMQNRLLIVTAPTAPSAGLEGDLYEAGFGRLTSLSPATSDADHHRRLLRSLGYSIRRQHTNLRAHVQLIHLLATQDHGGNKLCDAVVDLFSLLAGRGVALRQRLENLVAPHLQETQRARITAVQAASALPHASMAAEAPTELALVTPFDPHSAADTDPVAYADQLLCLGDYAEAMAVLEKALPRSPASADIATALQAIYRSARDEEAYERSRTLVLAAAPEAGDLWPAAGQFFGGR